VDHTRIHWPEKGGSRSCFTRSLPSCFIRRLSTTILARLECGSESEAERNLRIKKASFHAYALASQPDVWRALIFSWMCSARIVQTFVKGSLGHYRRAFFSESVVQANWFWFRYSTFEGACSSSKADPPPCTHTQLPRPAEVRFCGLIGWATLCIEAFCKSAHYVVLVLSMPNAFSYRSA
jgi:hypothetical protein